MAPPQWFVNGLLYLAWNCRSFSSTLTATRITTTATTMLITSTMCMVLSSWQSHCKSSLGSSDKRRLNTRSRLPTLTLSQPTWAANPPVGCCQPHPPRLFIIYSWRYLLVLVCAEKYLGCCFRGKQCAVDPSSFIGRFYGTFNNMCNSRNEMWNVCTVSNTNVLSSFSVV